MDGRGVDERQPLPKFKLEEVTRGSMAQVVDPGSGGWLDPGGVWYWVIVERRIEGGWFAGRVDAHCLIGPTLRDGGEVVFHGDNICYLWPIKVEPIFNSFWFRFLSRCISALWGGRTKLIKRLTDVNAHTLYQFSVSTR
jgi:hypothetical protein